MIQTRKKAICLFYIAIMLLSSICFTGCTDKKATITKTDFYFDTVVTITLYNASEKNINECFSLCEKYEKLFSRTDENSEISQINQNSKNGIYTTVSDETLELIEYGIEYSRLSNGRFDITIGNLTSLWDFTEQTDKKLPKEADIQAAVSNLGFSQIDIQGNEVLLTNPDISLDVGGIAKGYIADKLKEYLLSQNVKKGILNLGGNVLLIGTKTDGSNYNIGIQKPFDEDGLVIAVVNASDKSIVTSGVYERYFYLEDTLYHHILDTSTGYPVSNNLLSVTIISDNSIDGDGLSTGIFSLGMQEGIKLIESLPDVEAVFVDSEQNIHLTSGLKMDGNTIKLCGE